MSFRKTRALVMVAAVAGILAIAGCNSNNGLDDLGPGPDGGPSAVSLGAAGNFVILAKTSITTTCTTAITGDIGISPAALSDTEGFSATLGGGGTYATSDYVTGNIYAAAMTEPTPTNLTSAIGAMDLAYTNAAGLVTPDEIDLGAGEIGSLTLEPGLYKWTTGLAISTDVTLWGSDTAYWIFQIAEDLTVANGVQVTLAGGALAENILWQVGSSATLGTTAKFAGNLLTGTNIEVNTGASVNGRLLAKTAVTLQANAVTQP